VRISSEDLISCTNNACGCNGGNFLCSGDYFLYQGVCTGDNYDDTNWCRSFSLPPCDH